MLMHAMHLFKRILHATRRRYRKDSAPASRCNCVRTVKGLCASLSLRLCGDSESVRRDIDFPLCCSPPWKRGRSASSVLDPTEHAASSVAR